MPASQIFCSRYLRNSVFLANDFQLVFTESNFDRLYLQHKKVWIPLSASHLLSLRAIRGRYKQIFCFVTDGVNENIDWY